MKDILTYHFIHSHKIRLTVEKARYSLKKESYHPDPVQWAKSAVVISL